MNIGDKVRLMHGQEEGIITRFLDRNLVEVEIEDGFTIPVLQKELVVIAKEEKNYFREQQATKSTTKASAVKEIISEKGIYLSFLPVNDEKLSLHLVNNTDFIILASVSLEEKTNQYGIFADKLDSKSAAKINNWMIKDFDKWSPLFLQIIYHRSNYFSLKQPLLKKVTFRAASFFKKKSNTPILNKDGYVIQIDENQKTVDPDELKERFFAHSHFENKDHQQPKVEKVVDLHIEKLTRDFQNLGNEEILKLQLDYFEKKLDVAIRAGLDEITFIHGIGNGILRQNIHKILSQSPHISFYKDAMKEKFGFGATLVKIK